MSKSAISVQLTVEDDLEKFANQPIEDCDENILIDEVIVKPQHMTNLSDYTINCYDPITQKN
ncbi:MAG TPA: hypothetical protein V6C96_00110 [Vampirovibrionales bacterium]